MRAILLIDEMPENCDECPLQRWGIDGWNCTPKNKTIDDDDKPEWCPLKPLPQKLDANDWHRMFSGLFSEREAKGYGWNACLKEITDD